MATTPMFWVTTVSPWAIQVRQSEMPIAAMRATPARIKGQSTTQERKRVRLTFTTQLRIQLQRPASGTVNGHWQAVVTKRGSGLVAVSV